MLALGLLTYVYPVSISRWPLLYGLDWWSFSPEDTSKSYKWKVSLGIGILYISSILPMILFFKSGTFSQEFYTNPEALRFLNENFSEFLHVSKFSGMLITYLITSGLLPFSMIGTIYLLWDRDKKYLHHLNLFLVWILGICFISLGVVGIEHNIEMKFNLVPLQIDLIRGVRYLPFFMELILFLSLAKFFEKGKSTKIPNFSKLLIVIFVVVYSFGLRSNILGKSDLLYGKWHAY